MNAVAADPSRSIALLVTPVALAVAVTSATAAVAANGSLVAGTAPAAALLLIVLLVRAPIRVSLFTLTFLGLALDAPGEGGGWWQSPVAPLGLLLTENLNKSIPLGALTFPLSAVLLVCLVVIHAHRLTCASHIDDHAPVARTLLFALIGSGASVLVLIAWGAITKGDVQMAKNQAQNFVLVLLLAYLWAVALRGPRDYAVLGRVIVGAAVVKALMAIWVANMVLPARVLALDGHFATVHGDSLLFACATIIIGVCGIEWGVRRNRSAMLCLPVLLAGMLANNRRLVWVELSCSALVLYVVSQPRLKRQITRGLLIACIPALAYVGAGWNSSSAIFGPVKTLRSVQDSQVDASTLFRDIENYNLLSTIRSRNPVLASGFGHPFDMPVNNFDISFFKEYPFLPHNSILGLLAFTGAFGFWGVTVALLVGSFLAARSYGFARTPEYRVAAFTALAMIVIYEVQCWGDLGFSEKRSIYLLAPALAVAGQLAVLTGAWKDPPATGRDVAAGDGSA